MKTLGIIGGVGPESTMDYYRSIIALYRERKNDGSYPQFLINSIDLKKELDLLADSGALTKFLVEEIDKLARAGAQFGIIASNTPHLVFDSVQRGASIPLMSIVEATRDVARAMNLKRLALFGTTFTMRGNFYQDVFARAGMEIVVPSVPDQEFIHDKYMNELVNGIFRPETREALLRIVEKMRDEQKAEAVILGGTELPLILREESHQGILILNTTKIHVAAAVTEMLS